MEEEKMKQAKPKFHIEAQQHWPSFTHNGTELSLEHLDAHRVTFTGQKHSFQFVVTYGLHCFAKDEDDGTEPDASLAYSDGRETRPFSLERYELSKQLPEIVSSLSDKDIQELGGGRDKYRVIEIENAETGEVLEYKVGFCCFKENRLLRLHVTTAFIERRTDLKQGQHKRTSIFQIGMELSKRPRREGFIPKEAQNKQHEK